MTGPLWGMPLSASLPAFPGVPLPAHAGPSPASPLSFVIALALAGCAVASLPGSRLRPGRRSHPERVAAARPPARRALALGLGASAAAVLLGLPVALTVGAGMVAAIVGSRFATRRAPPSDTEMRELAGFLDVLAACLDGGSATGAALAACLDAGLIHGPAAVALDQTRALIVLGSDAPTAWDPTRRHAPLTPLATAATRSALGGVRLADAARETAAELRVRARAAADRRAARAGVAITAPLALCFLPSFMCLGLAPTIIGLVSSLHLW